MSGECRQKKKSIPSWLTSHQSINNSIASISSCRPKWRGTRRTAVVLQSKYQRNDQYAKIFGWGRQKEYQRLQDVELTSLQRRWGAGHSLLPTVLFPQGVVIQSVLRKRTKQPCHCQCKRLMAQRAPSTQLPWSLWPRCRPSLPPPASHCLCIRKCLSRGSHG